MKIKEMMRKTFTPSYLAQVDRFKDVFWFLDSCLNHY